MALARLLIAVEPRRFLGPAEEVAVPKRPRSIPGSLFSGAVASRDARRLSVTRLLLQPAPRAPPAPQTSALPPPTRSSPKTFRSLPDFPVSLVPHSTTTRRREEQNLSPAARRLNRGAPASIVAVPRVAAHRFARSASRARGVAARRFAGSPRIETSFPFAPITLSEPRASASRALIPLGPTP